jgi:hypothetical protein
MAKIPAALNPHVDLLEKLNRILQNTHALLFDGNCDLEELRQLLHTDREIKEWQSEMYTLGLGKIKPKPVLGAKK